MEKDELEQNGKDNLNTVETVSRENNAKRQRHTEVYMASVPREAVSL